MSSNGLPDANVPGEYELWDWGTKSPVDCMLDESHYDEHDMDMVAIFDKEMQYHLGAYTACYFICENAYREEGLDEHANALPDTPPWMKEAAEYKEQLIEERD